MAPWGSLVTELAHYPDDRIDGERSLAPKWPRLPRKGMSSPDYPDTMSGAQHEDLGQAIIMWCADWKPDSGKCGNGHQRSELSVSDAGLPAAEATCHRSAPGRTAKNLALKTSLSFLVSNSRETDLGRTASGTTWNAQAWSINHKHVVQADPVHPQTM